MKQRSLKGNVSRLFAALAVMLSCFAATAQAYVPIDTGAGTSLTVMLTDEGTAIAGAPFQLYRVGDVSETVGMGLAGDFASAPVALDSMESSSDWANMAVTLSAWASANGVAPTAEGISDANGSVVFNGLNVGLYLLASEGVAVGDYVYNPTSAMLMLPTLQGDDTWDYTPTVDVKSTKALIPAGFAQEQIDLTAKKVWDDNDWSGRPDGVSIQLLQDGEVLETVTLNAENNWTYTWENLLKNHEVSEGVSKDYVYQVNEVEAEGYTMVIELVEKKYDNKNDVVTATVTNTHEPEEGQTEETEISATNPTSPNTATTGTGSTTLPQTGMLNWPIPVLTIAGLVLIALGWYLLNGKKNKI